MPNHQSRPTAHQPDTEVGTTVAAPQGPDAAETPPSPPKLLDLTPTQVLAGSLAAATAAFLGSRLGVAGTIVGAALASVISATAASLYSGSLRRARHVVVRKRERGLNDRAIEKPARPTGPLAPPVAPLVSDGPVVRRVRWRGVLATASVLFAVGVAFLAGIQVTTGQPVTGTDVGTRVVARQGADGNTGSSGGGQRVPASNGTGVGSSSSGLPTPKGTAAPLTGTVTSPTTAPTTGAGSPTPSGPTATTASQTPTGPAAATTPARAPNLPATTAPLP